MKTYVFHIAQLCNRSGEMWIEAFLPEKPAIAEQKSRTNRPAVSYAPIPAA